MKQDKRLQRSYFDVDVVPKCASVNKLRKEVEEKELVPHT